MDRNFNCAKDTYVPEEAVKAQFELLDAVCCSFNWREDQLLEL